MLRGGDSSPPLLHMVLAVLLLVAASALFISSIPFGPLAALAILLGWVFIQILGQIAAPYIERALDSIASRML